MLSSHPRVTHISVFYPLVRPDIRPSVRPDIRPCGYPSVRPSRYPSVRISVRPSGYPSVHPSVFAFYPYPAFETVGLDFAGSISYKIKKKVQGKCYVALYTCATFRAVHLDLLPDMTAEELKGSIVEFIARTGRPDKIVRDSVRSLAISKWLQKLKRSQVVSDYLARREIHWQFNLALSPWWVGSFEPMVGLMKNAFRKAIGNANLAFKQLKKVLFEVEIPLNNRPLGYDIEIQPLTPNRIIHGANISLREEEPRKQDDHTNPKQWSGRLNICKDDDTDQIINNMVSYSDLLFFYFLI